MKAFLLAAGLGTRLRPITDTRPKCLVPIGGKPLLQWWAELFWKHGITEVLINTHYLPDPVREFIKKNNNSLSGVKFYEAYEEVLVGSGGTVRNNKSFVEGEKDFLICYADNLTDINLTNLIASHASYGGVLTMALFCTEKPKECGIVELDDRKRIIGFVEKPETPKSNLANAGIYVANNAIFEYMDDKVFLDFGKNILPKLVGKMYGWENSDYLLDIGTMDNYKKAQIEWKRLKE